MTSWEQSALRWPLSPKGSDGHIVWTRLSCLSYMPRRRPQQSWRPPLQQAARRPRAKHTDMGRGWSSLSIQNTPAMWKMRATNNQSKKINSTCSRSLHFFLHLMRGRSPHSSIPRWRDSLKPGNKRWVVSRERLQPVRDKRGFLCMSFWDSNLQPMIQ